MPAYLRPTVQSRDQLKFAARTYGGSLAFAALGSSAIVAAYTLANGPARLYFSICGLVCFTGGVWRLFWRDDLTIDLRKQSYVVADTGRKYIRASWIAGRHYGVTLAREERQSGQPWRAIASVDRGTAIPERE